MVIPILIDIVSIFPMNTEKFILKENLSAIPMRHMLKNPLEMLGNCFEDGVPPIDRCRY